MARQNPERLRRFIVVYDVSSDRERRRIDAVLKGFGTRVQESAFFVTSSVGGLKRLIDALGALEIRTGQVLLVQRLGGQPPICIGKAFVDPDAQVAYVV